MLKVFTANNFLEMQIIRDLLRENGIDCMTKGESSMASGLAAGELPPLFVKNTVHIFEARDEARALQLIEEYFAYQGLDADWVCKNCGETVTKNFTQCWNCEAVYAV